MEPLYKNTGSFNLPADMPVDVLIWANSLRLLTGYSYASSNSIANLDPMGLKVFRCCRDVQINPIIHFLFKMLGFKHCWLKTNSKEVGMGPARERALPMSPIGTSTKLTDHSGQSLGADCKEIQCVDEGCVDKQLVIGKNTGRWYPWNQCNSVVNGIISKCRTTLNLPSPIPPSSPHWPGPY